MRRLLEHNTKPRPNKIPQRNECFLAGRKINETKKDCSLNCIKSDVAIGLRIRCTFSCGWMIRGTMAGGIRLKSTTQSDTRHKWKEIRVNKKNSHWWKRALSITPTGVHALQKPILLKIRSWIDKSCGWRSLQAQNKAPMMVTSSKFHPRRRFQTYEEWHWTRPDLCAHCDDLRNGRLEIQTFLEKSQMKENRSFGLVSNWNSCGFNSC